MDSREEFAMLIGYARVSTPDQKFYLQKDALRKAGCKRIFTDVASGGQAVREGLGKVLEFLRPHDTLVVWKLDRLGRSLKHLIEIVTALQKRQIGFRSLQENLDTTTSGGTLVFHVFGALAEFERGLVQDRTHAGLAAARARGRKGGRRRVMDEKKVAMAVSLLQNPATSVAEVCQTLKVSRATLYQYVPAKAQTPPLSSVTQTKIASAKRKSFARPPRR
jgi:DNA invertase Pin-like site-specific DNA recombinase